MAAKQTGSLRKYELMVILKATLPDTQKKVALKKVQDLVKSYNGEVEEENIWGKRFMQYSIKKHREGYYVLYNIVIDPAQANELKRQLNIDGDVLRYLLRTVEDFEVIAQPETSKRERD